MAAPPEVTTKDLSGVYIMNRQLSDDTDEILRLQGISWFTRKIIASITLTLYIKHYKDDDGEEHIDIEQLATGGFKASDELRTLDWKERNIEDRVFGPIIGKSRRIAIEKVEDEWQKEGWLPDTLADDGIEAHVESDTEKSGRVWVANLIWGFAEIDGKRMYTRRVHFTGPNGEDLRARLVYDYQGPDSRT